jgi:hypothetical protein
VSQHDLSPAELAGLGRAWKLTPVFAGKLTPAAGGINRTGGRDLLRAAAELCAQVCFHRGRNRLVEAVGDDDAAAYPLSEAVVPVEQELREERAGGRDRRCDRQRVDQ